MRATPLQPSLINPAYMMTHGIGNNKKSLCLPGEEIPGLIMKQNNLTSARDYYDDTNDSSYPGSSRRPYTAGMLARGGSQKHKISGGA